MPYPTREIEHKVNYCDTDAGGVVYYGRYLEYFEAGRMEYLAAIGCDAVECHRQGVFFAVREVNATYRSSARLGDRLQIRSTVTQVTKYHMTFYAEVREADSDALLVEARIKCVCMNAAGKLLRLPAQLSEPLARSATSAE